MKFCPRPYHVLPKAPCSCGGRARFVKFYRRTVVTLNGEPFPQSLLEGKPGVIRGNRDLHKGELKS